MRANSIREAKKYDWKKISLKYLNLYNKIRKEILNSIVCLLTH